MEEFKGHLILLMGPTGSGKGSLVKYVQEQFPNLYFAVSCTTREKRPNEIDGVDYYFLNSQQFDEKINAEDFLEWAEFSGNRYGTLKQEVVAPLYEGRVVLNEIELQGVQQLLPIVPEDHRTLVYIEAGDWEALKSRALARAPISQEHLNLRHQRFIEEVKMKPLADVVINNTDGKLKEAKAEMRALVQNIFEQTK